MRTRHTVERSGFTLIEILVVLTLTSVVLGLIGTTLHRAMRTHHEAQRFCEDEGAAWRLSHQVRRDFRTAESVTIGELDGALTISLTAADGRTVAYHFLPRSVERTELGGSDNLTRRDRFPLSAATAWRFERDGPRIVLEAEGGSAKRPAFRLACHVPRTPQEAAK